MKSMTSRYNKPQAVKCTDKGRRKSAKALHREVVEALFPALKKTVKKKTAKRSKGRVVVTAPVYRTQIVNGLIVHEDDGKQGNQ